MCSDEWLRVDHRDHMVVGVKCCVGSLGCRLLHLNCLGNMFQESGLLCSVERHCLSNDETDDD